MNLPTPPELASGEVVYSNQNHVLNEEVRDLLVHNQRLWAYHEAKGYHGVVFAVTETVPDTEQALPLWYEYVFVWSRQMAIYRGWRLEEVIEEVVNDCGYA